MAKKVIAGLKKATEVVKVIKPYKSLKTHKYRFKTRVLDKEDMDAYLKAREEGQE
jgi:hypothetical protein